MNNNHKPSPPPDWQPPLTPRERECLRWSAEGKTDWEIGEILGLSKYTTHEHIENAKRKLDAKTRTQAVAIAVRKELI